ncbi:hypothetical protein QVD17_38066 [Tagetes erecta]|uniref:Uncharacterized protein n=1 Tax=Tagetes erecta TaxID=13708 RepID=A0AAD8JVV4_TARER|nr:hypothetical protein QVD17_38066 [Tagetes erecta]
MVGWEGCLLELHFCAATPRKRAGRWFVVQWIYYILNGSNLSCYLENDCASLSTMRQQIDFLDQLEGILRYLKGTISHGLTISGSATSHLHAYSDADWAWRPDDFRTTTGYYIFLGPNLITLVGIKVIDRSTLQNDVWIVKSISDEWRDKGDKSFSASPT